MRLDMRKVVEILEDALDLAGDFDGAETSGDRDSALSNSAERAQTTRDLLYLAHLCDAARVEVMNEYHRYRRTR